MIPMMIATHLWAWWKKGVGFEDMEENQPLLFKFIDLLVLTHHISEMEDFWLEDENKLLNISFWYYDETETEDLWLWVEDINHHLSGFGCPWKLCLIEEVDMGEGIILNIIELAIPSRKRKLEK